MALASNSCTHRRNISSLAVTLNRSGQSISTKVPRLTELSSCGLTGKAHSSSKVMALAAHSLISGFNKTDCFSIPSCWAVITLLNASNLSTSWDILPPCLLISSKALEVKGENFSFPAWDKMASE